jgi:hypothetical protein
MEKLYVALQKLGKAENLVETFQTIFSSVKDIINCQSATSFVFENIFNENEKKALNVQKTIIQSLFIDAICEQGQYVQTPCFHSLKESRNPIYTSKYISLPLFDSKGDLIATFQVESNFKLKKVTAEHA